MKVKVDALLEKPVWEFCEAHNISAEEAVNKFIRMAIKPLTIEPFGFRKVKPEEK